MFGSRYVAWGIKSFPLVGGSFWLWSLKREMDLTNVQDPKATNGFVDTEPLSGTIMGDEALTQPITWLTFM